MKPKLDYKKFKPKDIHLIKAWLEHDRLGMKFLSSYATDDFVDLIDFKKRYLWIVYIENIPVGFFDFEIESNEKACFTFYVCQEVRGRGVGYELLQESLKLMEVRGTAILEGGVEKDNISSIRTLEKAGFRYTSINEDGNLAHKHKTRRSGIVSGSIPMVLNLGLLPCP